MKFVMPSVLVSCLALLSSTSTFAETRYLRVTNSYSNADGSVFYGPAQGIRPSLSADGTVLLYTMFSMKDNVATQSVQMDRITLDGPPSVIKDSRLQFPSGAPTGSNVYISTEPSMSGNGAVVATAPVYESTPEGGYRDHVMIFSVGPNNAVQRLFEKSGEDVDSVNSIRVSRNGNYVAYVVVSYLEDAREKSTVYVYDVRAKSEKEVWSKVFDFADVGIKGISDDGKRILLGSAYESEPSGGNVSVLNVKTGAVSMITNVKDSMTSPCSASWDGDGVMTAFAASAPLAKGDTNRALDVYLASTFSPEAPLRISSLGGKQGNFSSGQPVISRNGRFVAFVSKADNLRPNDTNYVKDLYVYSLNRGNLLLYTGGNEDINLPSIADSGTVVSFVSSASDIVPNDTNKADDIFVGRPFAIPVK